jgi:hypothetical protein
MMAVATADHSSGAVGTAEWAVEDNDFTNPLALTVAIKPAGPDVEGELAVTAPMPRATLTGGRPPGPFRTDERVGRVPIRRIGREAFPVRWPPTGEY